jgi:hypothetical protein
LDLDVQPEVEVALEAEEGDGLGVALGDPVVFELRERVLGVLPAGHAVSGCLGRG